jgi:hypothetical protein
MLTVSALPPPPPPHSEPAQYYALVPCTAVLLSLPPIRARMEEELRPDA